MGTVGVAVTCFRALNAWRGPLMSHGEREHACGRVSPFETVRARNNLDPIKPVCISPLLPSWSRCLFLLCVIHIRNPPPLHLQHPTMYFV